MCKVYGYCRISRKEQNIERQERNIKAAFPDAFIVKEAFTGTKIDGRKEFLWILKAAEAGDTIVFDSVSRMSRNAEEGFTEYQRLFNRGIELVFLKEPQISTATYKAAMETKLQAVKTGDAAADKLTAAIMEAIQGYMMSLAERQIKLAFEQAQKEVDDLHQRTKEGIETARLHGKQIGQKAGNKLQVKKAAAAKEGIKKFCQEFGGKFTDAETMIKVHVSKPTFYKYKREIRAELEAAAELVEQAINAEF